MGNAVTRDNHHGELLFVPTTMAVLAVVMGQVGTEQTQIFSMILKDCQDQSANTVTATSPSNAHSPFYSFLSGVVEVVRQPPV